MADRRTFLQGLAATVAIPATVSARAADATEPDAELIALGQEWATSREQLDAAWEAHEDACDRWDGGPPPAAELFVRKFDSPLSYSAVRYNADKVRWYGRPEIVERLRNLHLEAVPEIHRTDGTLQPAVPDLKARARRDEIMAAYERWQADRAVVAEACGLTAATARTDAEIEVNSAVRRRIIKTRATTLAGMLVKARVAAHCHGGIEEMEQNAFNGSPTDEALMCSLVLDLIKMEQTNV